MENYTDPGHETRGTEGPLGISEVTEQNPLYDALLNGAVSIGHPRNADYNGPDQEGVARLQATIQKGRRMNTAHCYLKPASRRSNLHIVTNAMTHNVRYKANDALDLYTIKTASWLKQTAIRK